MLPRLLAAALAAAAAAGLLAGPASAADPAWSGAAQVADNQATNPPYTIAVSTLPSVAVLPGGAVASLYVHDLSPKSATADSGTPSTVALELAVRPVGSRAFGSPATVAAPASGVQIGSPALAADAQGRLTAVWTESAAGEARVMSATRSDAGDWSSPVTVYDSNPSSGVSLAGVRESGDGTVGLIAQDCYSTLDGSISCSMVAAVRDGVTGAWSTHQLATSPCETFQGGAVGVGADGTVTAAYSEPIACPASGGITEWQIEASTLSAGGSTWSDAHTLSDSGEHPAAPQVVVDAQGRSTVFFTQQHFVDGSGWTPSTLYAADDDAGGAWSAASVVVPAPSTGTGDYFPQAAVDDAGDTTLAWFRDDGSGTNYTAGGYWAMRRPAGGSWGDPQPIGSGYSEGSVETLGLSIDPASGDAVAAWYTQTGLYGNSGEVRAATRPGGSDAWSAAAVLDTSSDVSSVDFRNVRSAIRSGAGTAVVWEADHRSSGGPPTESEARASWVSAAGPPTISDEASTSGDDSGDHKDTMWTLIGRVSTGHCTTSNSGDGTYWRFEYEPDSSFDGSHYGNATPYQLAGADVSLLSVWRTVSSLVPGAGYHWRLAAKNVCSGEEAYAAGPDRTFTTAGGALDQPPTFTVKVDGQSYGGGGHYAQGSSVPVEVACAVAPGRTVARCEHPDALDTSQAGGPFWFTVKAVDDLGRTSTANFGYYVDAPPPPPPSGSGGPSPGSDAGASDPDRGVTVEQRGEAARGELADVPPSLPASGLLSHGTVIDINADLPGTTIVQGSGVIAAGGGNVIAAGGGNVIAAGGGNVIAAGGGNVIAAGGGNVIAAGGGNVISSNGAGLASSSGLGFGARAAAAGSPAIAQAARHCTRARRHRHRRCRHRPKQALLFAGGHTFTAPGRAHMRLKPTRAGRRALRAYAKKAAALRRRHRRMKPLRIALTVIVGPVKPGNGKAVYATRVVKVKP